MSDPFTKLRDTAHELAKFSDLDPSYITLMIEAADEGERLRVALARAKHVPHHAVDWND